MEGEEGMYIVLLRDGSGLMMVDEDLSTAALRNVERPWKEVVITFTGVEQKVRQDKERLG